MEFETIKQFIAAAARFKPPFAFTIVFVLLLAIAGDNIPERFTNLVYLLVIAAFGLDAWTYWHGKRSDKAQDTESPGVESSPKNRSLQESTPATDPADLRSLYLTELPIEWNRLRLLGVDRRAADPAKATVRLDQVYVALDTQTPRPDALKDREREKNREPQPPLTALEATLHAAGGRLVVLGRPGSGKSTFGRHLCAELAEACRDPGRYDWADNLPGWVERRPLLPVFLSLGQLARGLVGLESAPGVADIESFIRAEMDRRRGLGGFGKPLLSELKSHGGLVCFDGLDEVPNAQRGGVRAAVAAFAKRYGRCRVLVSCRTHTYQADPEWQLAGWETHELAGLDPQRQQGYIGAWYAAMAQVDPARGKAFYQAKAGSLQRAVAPGAPRKLDELAVNPLLLTVMLRVHTEQELPDSRVDVFDACVDVLLVHWSAAKQDESEGSILDRLTALKIQHLELYNGLRRLAYDAVGSVGAAAEGRALVAEGQIRQAMGGRLGADGTAAFLDYCRDANGLLLFEGEQPRPDAAPDEPPEAIYTFPHSYFQEYLAARHLATQPLEKAAALAGDPAWREVVLFLGEHFGFSAKNADALKAAALVNVLTPEESGWNEAALRRTELAGDLAAAFGDTVPIDPQVGEHLTKCLVRLLQDHRHLTQDGPLRANAGRVLAQLGDPRPGVGLDAGGLPDLRWVAVPSVEGLRLGTGMRGEEDKNYRSDNERWASGDALHLPPFLLAAHPVTVAQFRSFVEQGGYKNRDWWTDAGWETVCVEEKRKAPYAWDNPNFTQPNQPVIGVTWYEAVAWCNWLTAQLREAGRLSDTWRVRLPTEAEWEWAARGPDGRRWPWGDDWQACNNEEVRIGRPCAVGAFGTAVRTWDSAEAVAVPDLLRADRLWDQAGNVWEWCATRGQDEYPLPAVDEWSDDYLAGDDWRVLRGGAYYNDRAVVRGACRNWSDPGDWDGSRGFRCCAATSSR